MTSTEIAIREPAGQVTERDVVDGWLAVASDVIKLASVIAPTEFVPAEYRDNPPAVAAAILAGRELGIGPMTSLRHVQVVKGTPTLSAEYKRARVLSAGHEFDILELNTTRCRVAGRRKGSNKPPLEITFTIEDARTAGLIKDKGAWRTRPRRMLFARAGSELCDFLFSDVVNGLPTAEIVADGAEDDEFAGYDEPPAKPAQRTAQRRQGRAAEPKPDPTAQPAASKPGTASSTAPAAGSLSPTGGADGLPPLPGEEDEPPAQPPFDPDEHGTATRGKGGQLTALWTILSTVYEFGPEQKDQARAVAEHVIGRDLPGTTGDLSFNEARMVLDTLANWQKVAESRGEHPREVMIAAMAGGSVDA